jgi:hypothetical protein
MINNDSGGRCFAYQLEGCDYLDDIEGETAGEFKIDRGLRVDKYH